MAFDFFRFLRPKDGVGTHEQVTCKELFEAAKELQIRELCFWTCVNMIANAMGRCEFRTFTDHKEVYGKEYYLWNFEPNANQNSTVFIHKLISTLYSSNEALIIGTRQRNGSDALVVADSWAQSAEYPSKQNEYRNVTVGDVKYDKTFRENDVIHLKLNHVDIKPVIDGMYDAYYQLIDAAQQSFLWDEGKHMKVHVDQVAEGEDGWEAKFAEMIKNQTSPFLKSRNAVLPEFDGYKYELIGEDSPAKDTRDIKELVEDIFDFTARAMLIPAVLVNGKIEGTKDANTRFLTNCIDPICDQLQEEIVRKRYGFEGWSKGNTLRVDSSAIIHFDLFANAANVEKVVGSGAYTINDVRRAANQATINEPWADKHYLTLNIAGIDKAGKQLEDDEPGGKE